ncbi:hypothetical protein D3C78_952050 [compost metagenome]
MLLAGDEDDTMRLEKGIELRPILAVKNFFEGIQIDIEVQPDRFTIARASGY